MEIIEFSRAPREIMLDGHNQDGIGFPKPLSDDFGGTMTRCGQPAGGKLEPFSTSTVPWRPLLARGVSHEFPDYVIIAGAYW